MTTLPTEDRNRLDAKENGSTQQLLQRLLEERARQGERKQAIYQALLQRQLHDEMDRVWGGTVNPQASSPHHLRHLTLLGSLGFLGFLLISLISAPTDFDLTGQALMAQAFMALTKVLALGTLVLLFTSCLERARRRLPASALVRRAD